VCALLAGGWDWAPSRCSPGTRQRDFDGTNLELEKLPENAPTPTTTVLVFLQGSGARCVGRLLVFLDSLQDAQLPEIMVHQSQSLFAEFKPERSHLHTVFDKTCYISTYVICRRCDPVRTRKKR
jgi:hypothetical protein